MSLVDSGHARNYRKSQPGEQASETTADDHPQQLHQSQQPQAQRGAPKWQRLNDAEQSALLANQETETSTTSTSTSTPSSAAPKSTRSRGSRSNSASRSAKQLCSSSSSCHTLVEQLLTTVGELENTLITEHQTDFRLRMALEHQTEKVHSLRSSLDTEKQRNQRLMQLIRGVDSSSSTDDENDYLLQPLKGRHAMAGSIGGASLMKFENWQSRSSMDAFESISPLLMQQRYDELSMSYKKCRRQLVKKEKLLTVSKCEKEELQSKHDYLIDEYRGVQKRLEELCCRYLRLQMKKNQEIQKLKDALSCASDCILSAQKLFNTHKEGVSEKRTDQFRQNFKLFVKTLKSCDWVQKDCNRANCSGSLNVGSAR